MRGTTFMNRTRDIHRHTGERARKCGRHLDYDLEAFRQVVERAMAEGGCPYCDACLTAANFSCDHDVPISRGGSFGHENVVVCCRRPRTTSARST